MQFLHSQPDSDNNCSRVCAVPNVLVDSIEARTPQRHTSGSHSRPAWTQGQRAVLHCPTLQDECGMRENNFWTQNIEGLWETAYMQLHPGHLLGQFAGQMQNFSQRNPDSTQHSRSVDDASPLSPFSGAAGCSDSEQESTWLQGIYLEQKRDKVNTQVAI